MSATGWALGSVFAGCAFMAGAMLFPQAGVVLLCAFVSVIAFKFLKILIS